MSEQWEPPQSAPVMSHSAPYPNHNHHQQQLQQLLHGASVPDSASEALALSKAEPFGLYENSRIIFESRRKYQRAINKRLPPFDATFIDSQKFDVVNVVNKHSKQQMMFLAADYKRVKLLFRL